MMLKQGISFKRVFLTLFFISALVLIVSGCKPKVEVIPVESITISAANNASSISTIGGTLQFTAVVLPADADDKSVTWSVQDGTGEATISINGLLTAVENGTVTVKATSKADSTKVATKVITISNQDVLASSISIASEDDAAFIDLYHGTLQMSAVVLPANAANKNVVWSVENGTGSATISASGLLSAVTNGTVTVKATSAQNGAVYGTKIITLTNQDPSVTSVEIISAGNASIIDEFQGTLQLSVVVLPALAADKSVVWSVENGTGSATITQAGLLTAVSNGSVTVHAVSVSNTTIEDEMVITLSNQEVVVTSIELTSAGNLAVINQYGGTLQFNANVLPANAVDKAVLWTVTNGSGEATISSSGLLTAVSNGTVTVVVTSVSNSAVNASMLITMSNQEVVVSSVTVSGAGDAVIIDQADGTLQMSALVLPENAADKSVVWSVTNGTGVATINATGLLTAVSNGTVVVKATSVSNNAIMGTKEITISNQAADATSIEVQSAGNVSIINTFGGTLQFSATVLPVEASQSVIWSVVNGTGEATISANGLLTAVDNGSVTVKATAANDALIFDTMEILISNQEVLITSITVSGQDDATTIDTFGGTLQMVANVLPINADNQLVLWSVENGSGEATINSSGILSAVSNGTVVVKATSANQPMIFGELTITITDQDILVTSVEIESAENAIIIDTFGGTLQFSAIVLPIDASDKTVVWSVVNGTGEATISVDGLLTAQSNGTVTVKAAATSDALMFDEMEITISNQEVLITSISVIGFEGATTINTFDGTLQMVANILPENADNKLVLWSVENGTGEATISGSGLLTAGSNGTVIVTATSVNQPLIFGSTTITISNQEILVTSIEVLSEGNTSVIDVFGGTLQLSVNVLPINADDMSVLWSVENVTGEATIDQNGLLTAVADGTVVVKATSVGNPTVFGTKEITISNQVVVVEPEAPVDLGTAGNFTILAKTGISTAADSTIIGDMGVSPVAATYITGFSLILDSTTTFATSAQVTGMIYAADYTAPTPANLTTAVSDMEAAYVDAAGRAADFTELHAGNLSGQTLVGGVYKYGTDVVAYSNVTLSGSAEDVWIFQISGTYTQAVSVQILLDGGALAENVFWQIADSVAIETGAHFVGVILSMTEISLGTGATVNGRLLSQTAVTLDANAVSQNVLVAAESIVLSSEMDAVAIDTFHGTLQMFAEVLPVDATNKAVIYSVINGTGSASISEAGLLSALSDGTVTVKVESVTNPLIFDTMEILLSNQTVLVSSVSLSADAAIIDSFGGTLQVNALVLPADAANKAVTWSVENVTGEATVDENGLLTAVANGTVIVKAVSNENVEIFGTLEITISNQDILAESILVSSEGDVIVIDVAEGTLQMYAEVLPVDADDKLYTWSVEDGTGEATISELGVLSAVANGTVLVKATLNSNVLIFGSLEITISNQVELAVYGPVALLSAEDFTILSKTGITTTVGTHITGNIGASPIGAAAMTGFGLVLDASGEFSTSSLVAGMVYAADYAAPTPTYLSQAVLDMEAAYADAAGRTPDFINLHAGNISGQTLVPGVYHWTTGLLIDTDVTLSGNATDVWIFQVEGTIAQAASVSIILSGGAVAENIVWQVAAAVTIGANAHFEGTILGMTSVGLGSGASYIGKIFAQTAVTLDGNDIN